MFKSAHDEHVRSLLDHRPFFDSALSEYSDTPSVYSRPNFSPYASPISTHPPHHPPSMLDFDDDRASSSPSSPAYRGDDDDASRMSYLGPKMRFHSRAPWEMDGDPVPEEDEADSTRGFPFSRPSVSKSSSSSPRPSHTTRPSQDSARSQILPKRSFDTINSQMSYPQGALYALAQETLSNQDLSRPPKETLRGKFSLGRLLPHPATASVPPSPNRAQVPTSFIPFARVNDPPTSPFETTAHSNTPHAPYFNNPAIHPYANPDLVVSYADDEPRYFHSAPSYPRNAVTESFSTESLTKSTSRSTLTPDTSMNSMSSKQRTSPVQSKFISAPVNSDHRPDFTPHILPPGVNQLPGWTERQAPPTFSLISLEEARAQRMQASNARMSSATVASNFSTAFSEYEHVDIPPFANIRGRSTSTGAKGKTAIPFLPTQPERRDSEPTVSKSLKHKKSGFMRLFNGSKVPTRDESSSPPPVPSLPASFFNPQPVPRVPRPLVRRNPVPSLLLSSFEVATDQSTEPFIPESNSPEANVVTRPSPPLLSINTSTLRSSSFDVTERPIQPWQNEQVKSAPANVTEFPALKLRPVSTLFSAHFADHIGAHVDSRSSDEASDPETPRSASPNGLISPMRTTNDPPSSAVSTDDQAALKSLQEQLKSTKAAWQRHVRELEGQLRDLKTELEESKGKHKHTDDYCETCGRGQKKEIVATSPGGVLNRPRARTGTSSRFGNAMP